jgi:glycosyltransferase involved in cell wall biosynthesis
MDDGSKIRVMFVTPCFGYGGLERVVLDIIASIDRSRFTPFFCTLLAPDAEMFRKLERLDVPSTVIDKGDGVSWSLAVRLSRLLRRERIDLVNPHDIGATLYAAPAARMAGIDAVVHTDHSQILTKKRLLPVYRWVLQHLVTGSVTVSRDLEAYLVEEMGVDRARIVTIPNGIDVKKFEAAVGDPALRKQLGIAEGASVIGSVGRLTEQKGMEYLIDAFPAVIARHPGAALVIVGDGELRAALEKRAVDNGLEGRIVFTGIRDDVSRMLGLFDIFVLPSLWEGQPITIMEAMASGRPIVATDVGGNGEILQSGRLGILVPSRDPDAIAGEVNRLIEDPSMAAGMRERAHSHAVSALDRALMTRRYEEVFISCLRDGAPA